MDIFNIHPQIKRMHVQHFWKNPDISNAPASYTIGMERSSFLIRHACQHVPVGGKILEIGCNVGRNLNTFYHAGYKRIEGIEINPGAIALMKNQYPEMVRSPDFKIYNNPVEEVIGKLPDDYDLVFTMAVLEHIPPASEHILPEICRLARNGVIITVEDELNNTSRHFAREYRKIFEKLGRKQVYQENCAHIPGLGEPFWLRVFK